MLTKPAHGGLWGIAALGVGLAFFGWLAWSFRGYTPDDTYIYFRYAQNFAAGRGLVFNPGERVYGSTSLPWTLLLAAAEKAGLPLLATAKVTGAALGAMTIIVVQRIVQRIDRRAAIAAPLVMAGFIDLPYWAVSGMDTALFGCVIATALLATVRAADGGAFAVAGLAWGIAAAVRPEGTALGLSALGWLILRDRVARRDVIRAVTMFALPVAATLLFAWMYYGDVVPNTYWAKRFDRAASLHHALIYLRAFAMANEGALMIGALAGACLLSRARAVRLMALTLSVYVACLLWTGGDSWRAPHVFRVAAPMLAPLGVLMAVGLTGVWVRVTAGVPAHAASAGTALVLAAWLAFPSAGGLILRRVGGDPGIVAHLVAHAGPDDAVAVTDIGWVGYETDLRVVDMFGLVDRWVARSLRKRNGSRYHAGEAERLTDYVMGRAPRWIILKGTRRPDGTLDVHDETGAPVVYRDARFVERYRLVLAGSPEPYLLFERRAAS